jgi:hypothetical protein
LTTAPHDEQKFASALFSAPQFEHVLTVEAYSAFAYVESELLNIAARV